MEINQLTSINYLALVTYSLYQPSKTFAVAMPWAMITLWRLLLLLLQWSKYLEAFSAIYSKLNKKQTTNLYGSECWAVTKNDVHKIDALDQWCLRMLLGINWHQHVRNDEVRRLTKQSNLSAIVQSRRVSLFGHIARMPDETDAKQILTASPAGNWRRPLGRITWMKTIQQDLKSSDLNMDDAVDLAQNRPLWRLMSTFGAKHS